MSITTVSLISFIAVAAILAISKRTRPLVTVVSALWLVGLAVYDFGHSQSDAAIGLLIVAGGITARAIQDRKKLIAQLKG